MAACALSALLTTPSAMGQQPIRFDGLLMRQAAMSSANFVELSQPQLYGTARSMAMADAFVSLGGDVASASINPAGLGMFRSSQVTFTPLVTVQRSSSSAAAYKDNGKTRVALADLGLVYNAYNGSGTVTGVSIALGYHRVADLNYRTSYQWTTPFDGKNAGPSLPNLLAGQLTQEGIYPDKEGSLGYYGDRYPDLWGAMMAYDTGLIYPYEDADGSYWDADMIGHNATIGHFFDMESIGSINEFYLAGGLNLGNEFYIGATIGIQSVAQKKHVYYGETYRYKENGSNVPAVNRDGQQLISQADFMNYNQASRISGTGINFKIGAIWRPTQSVRVGVALHTPTYYWLEHEYGGQMATQIYNNDEDKYYHPTAEPGGTWVDPNDAWQFNTPTRLMFGASYAFGTRGIVSVDYERDWYNGIRVSDEPWWIPDPDEYAGEVFKHSFRGTNTVRIGAEYKPLERWSLRAGFAYTNSMLRHGGSYFAGPVPDKTYYITAGTGFQLGRGVTLDLVYQYGRMDTHAYRLFYADSGESLLDAAEPVSTRHTRHNIAFTLGFRF